MTFAFLADLSAPVPMGGPCALGPSFVEAAFRVCYACCVFYELVAGDASSKPHPSSLRSYHASMSSAT
ncbi:conserved hypothetical protein [Ricinus communis]|uniref:Uncharacterized protein n=1 Tax=Ricinus communis TaxID=3988 RepID=B9RU61_RICCO|nr:conserved hypothetical protein [Ricinus communis]